MEASPYDKIYGIGMDEDHKHAKNPAKWKGKNLLGFTLMKVRHDLKTRSTEEYRPEDMLNA